MLALFTSAALQVRLVATRFPASRMKAHAGLPVIGVLLHSGWTASPMHSLYSSTKFALRAINDGLRLELRPFGIAVSALYATRERRMNPVG